LEERAGERRSWLKENGAIPCFKWYYIRKLKIAFLTALCAVCLPGGGAFAAVTNSITLTINTSNPGFAVSNNFIGIGVSSFSIDGDGGYTKAFTTANTQMVNLFKQIGIKHLRTIMGKADPSNPDPSNSQIDAFFDFAAAAGVSKIIWSLHLYDAETTNTWSNNKAIAAHIWNTTTVSGTVESNLLESFAFDNEPDWLRVICCADPAITGYSTPATNGGYIGVWKGWQQAIAAFAPGAKFSGPDTGSKWPCPAEINTSVSGVPFTLQFATDASAAISGANQHFYGQTGISNFTALQLATACLSSNWLATNYATVNSQIVGSLPVPYRFTECSAFDNEVNPGNQCFATGLWALDFYHWWARHGCAGVDPFTRTAQYNAAIFFDGANYIAEPYAYAMKAFALGGSGNVIYTSKFLINNPGNINVTAYGVVNSNHLYVTVINKTFDAVGSATANVTIPAPAGFQVQNARYMVLSGGPTPGASGDPTINGACLGGAEITNDGSPWAGKWTRLPVTAGGVNLSVLPATAVIVDLQNYPLLSIASPPLDPAGFHLSVSAPSGSNVVVQASTNLVNWMPLYTNAGSFLFTDSNAKSAPCRFFRLQML
jgi:hypothetical protein